MIPGKSPVSTATIMTAIWSQEYKTTEKPFHYALAMRAGNIFGTTVPADHGDGSYIH
jgi:hypothetical protein